MASVKTPQDVLSMCRQHDVKAVDFRFTDFLGVWHHKTVPVSELNEDLFEDGTGFDGSSLHGWQSVHESDMLLVPQPETAFLDPFNDLQTLNLICNVQDPITADAYPRDPRYIARKAAGYLTSTGIADTAYIGAEAEFFVLDDVRFDLTPQGSFYSIDSIEAPWNRGRQESPNLGHKMRSQAGYFPCPPADQLFDLRNEIMQTLIEIGLNVECHHHEVGAAGQCEIDLRFDQLIRTADMMMMYKYVVKNVARRHGKTATFMPKPIAGEFGSGMHTHLSLWKDGDPLFAGSGYAGLSDLAVHAIGGILHHAPALLAFTNPTTNSYRRLLPGYEAPVHLAYGRRNRSVACRVPMYSPNPKAKRLEFRCPDPSSNPYLAFSAIVMAMIDGISNRISPGEPMDKDLFKVPADELAGLRTTPASLDEALRALEEDNDFLRVGDVFSEDVISSWIRTKRELEILPTRSQPTPLEYCLYFDV
ncbi:Glutamine synthetase 1 [Rosistilla carotiformis]|uniref:Glutamine synthetase 1 n=1 Tax=Rosistilla carotiformis TaxID=2528017 RepID=A0A518JW09_9BACT|nr:type I glutamate--ammonia ligase [Rosistilla carotiformis]QDV69724.1 Glutamine synthetase 1 [Rosistilla carotiformis]